MYQFTATLSGSYPPVQQQTQKIHGVRREDGWNQNFRGVLDTNIKQEFPDPRQNPLFENAGYGAPSTSNGWPRQTGITPLQVSPQPLFNRDPHAQERQLLVYHDRQPPSEYDSLADKSNPTQNIVHRNVTYPPPFANERPIRHLEYPPTANQSPSIKYGSFSSSQSEHHRKKAPRDNTRIYNNTYMRYTIKWKLTVNNKAIMPKDTEQDIVLAPSAYWQKFLKPKLEDTMRKLKRSLESNFTSVVISVTQRKKANIPKRFNNTSVNWASIESQFAAWSEFYRAGKQFKLKFSFDFIKRPNAELRRGDKRGIASTTWQILATKNLQLDAE
ncbi:hypothetical protein IFR05_016844 [Cadophora sp. M221]|nr:hypothetical protein IFR05_016844 [Cadophora sp. M221]